MESFNFLTLFRLSGGSTTQLFTHDPILHRLLHFQSQVVRQQPIHLIRRTSDINVQGQTRGLIEPGPTRPLLLMDAHPRNLDLKVRGQTMALQTEQGVQQADGDRSLLPSLDRRAITLICQTTHSVPGAPINLLQLRGLGEHPSPRHHYREALTMS